MYICRSLCSSGRSCRRSFWDFFGRSAPRHHHRGISHQPSKGPHPTPQTYIKTTSCRLSEPIPVLADKITYYSTIIASSLASQCCLSNPFEEDLPDLQETRKEALRKLIWKTPPNPWWRSIPNLRPTSPSLASDSHVPCCSHQNAPLPPQHYQALEIEEDYEMECMVCLAGIPDPNGMKVDSLPCGHNFHHQCLTVWRFFTTTALLVGAIWNMWKCTVKKYSRDVRCEIEGQ
jgi:hypothetical protein